MSRRVLLFALGAALIFGCKKETTPVTVTSQTQTTQTTQTTAVTTTTATAPVPAPVPTSQPATPAPQPAGSVLASQETNWKGIHADVTEFRRKGNSLTAKVRFTNRGVEGSRPDIIWKDVYLIDTGAGKKYEVLRDEKSAYIASRNSGWNDRWYETVEPNQSLTVWMKFPAPPPEVKAITLQLPNTPPFEDVTIQD
jgi:hypothetical protein